MVGALLDIVRVIDAPCIATRGPYYLQEVGQRLSAQALCSQFFLYCQVHTYLESIVILLVLGTYLGGNVRESKKLLLDGWWFTVSSLIGTLDQISLSTVLQRLEVHAKSGLLVVRCRTQWVEFYIRDGRLMCVGPVPTSTTLGERLLQDGIITQQFLREALQFIGAEQQSETRVALTLMDLGYVGHDQLRTWATAKALEVLQVLMSWSAGEIHFQEQTTPPSDRLLVAVSISSLLASISAPPPMQQTRAANPAPVTRPIAPKPPTRLNPIANSPTLTDPSQFYLGDLSAATSFPSTEALSPVARNEYPSLLPHADELNMPNTPAAQEPARPAASPVQLFSPMPTAPRTPAMQPAPVAPITPRRIDVSFLRPEMVLLPVDVSSAREQNPPVHLTPEQWRLLTKIDGQTTLQMACQQLAMMPEMICQITGELIAQGLIMPVTPGEGPVPEYAPVYTMGNGYVAPGAAAAPVQPWSAGASPLTTGTYAPPVTGAPPSSFETQAQWGNGGNGAIFIPGQGWVATATPAQSLTASGRLVAHTAYAQISN